MEYRKQKQTFLLFLVFTSPFCAQGDAGPLKKSCTDSDGKEIPHGTSFTPNYDEPCQTCICDDGYTTLCSTAACSPPPDCEQRKAVPRECCKFECGGNNSLPPSVRHNTTVDDVSTAEEDNITNLSLRLVASTVTSFLVLALLLFMVHRLRQRRLMMAMRRFEAQARQQRGEDDDADHYIPAAFLHIECPPYEDPPPPYSPPKPPHILPADSPPPYEELENDTTSDLDANANVSNNNNNNDRSCQQHGQVPHSPPGGSGGETERRASSQNAHLLEAVETLNTSSEGSSLDSCSQGTTGGRTSSSSQGREEETEMKLISRRQSHPYDRNHVPYPQDYSLFAAATARNVGNSACEQMVPTDQGNAESSADLAGRQRNSDSYGGGRGVGVKRGGGRGTRKTGRSCSFSLTRSTDEDVTMTGIALGPMSHSYHAATTTIDSGVQTHGSYTASLSRHKARGTSGHADRKRVEEEGDRGGEQRMVTKPMVKCDAAVQHSHRLLQEELRRSLPRTAPDVSNGQLLSCEPTPMVPSSINSQLGKEPACPDSTFFKGQQSSGPGHALNVFSGEGSSRVRRDSTSGRLGPGHGSMSPDPDSGMSVSCTELGSGSGDSAPLPRSQSIASTFSVCSETGEVHIRKASASADASVLQSDSQYPEHRAPRSCSSPPHLPANTSHQLSREHPASLPDYTFPSHTGLLPDAQVGRSKMASMSTSQSRRPVPSPPSQELRPTVSPSAPRSQSAKPKHKKIHFVPLEKSKTFRTKKDKTKGNKKGETDSGHRRHDSGCRTNGSCVPQAAVSQMEESTQQVRGHQLKHGDTVQGRLPANTPSVKQYGFLDLCPPAGTMGKEGYPDSSRNLEEGKDWRGDGGGGARPTSTPYHSLPHKFHAHNSATSHHFAGHRRQLPHSDKPHPTTSTTRPKSKSRPLSSGLVVEPGRDPSDPASVQSQNSLARRRVKTLHLKKSRQSYPAPDGALSGERKATCVDLGFVEPSQESGRTLCAGVDIAPLPLPPKRRAVDRGCDKLGLGADSTGVLEGRMSSYV